ncbi:MAG TPA: ShlB/FhaC/HecB family hemolysin secretion/activation protein, partial [Gammaproteobacteria bacterium]|nr:ShlB/FhaC/HecB family hemolysin secretion/activation protein [Gammaproteobacteria bacterium]
HGNLTLNNYNSIDTSALRLSGMLRYDNLWQKEHSVSLQYLTSPEDTSQVKVWSGTYLARSAFTRNLLAFYAVHSDSNIAAVGALAVVGKGDIAGLHAIFPLPGTRHFVHDVTFGVAYKHFKQNVLLLGADNLSTPIEYVPFTVQYQGTKFGDNATTEFGASVHFGIRGLVNSAREFENKRYNSKPNYFYLKARVERRQRLYRGIGLRLEAKGQLADSPLISNEELSAGGPGSVRGYHRSERFGDDAIQGTVELLSPHLVWGSWAVHVQEFRALAFWDGAALWVKNALPGQPGGYVLTSAGVGLRLSAWQHFDASLDVAQVYHTTSTMKKDAKRIVFKVEYSF